MTDLCLHQCSLSLIGVVAHLPAPQRGRISRGRLCGLRSRVILPSFYYLGSPFSVGAVSLFPLATSVSSVVDPLESISLEALLDVLAGRPRLLQTSLPYRDAPPSFRQHLLFSSSTTESSSPPSTISVLSVSIDLASYWNLRPLFPHPLEVRDVERIVFQASNHHFANASKFSDHGGKRHERR
jgi:hypothetical protein